MAKSDSFNPIFLFKRLCLIVLLPLVIAIFTHSIFIAPPSLNRGVVHEIIRTTLNEKKGTNNKKLINADTLLEGINVIVTGATAGLGKLISKELFSLGASVCLASRDLKKISNVIDSFRQSFPKSPGKLEPGILDTSDLDSVLAFVKNYKKSHSKLNFLVNNAGIHYISSPGNPLFNSTAAFVSKQGYDLAFATNYLGHFALTKALMPLLQSSANSIGFGRVLNIASTFHFLSDGTMLQPKDNNNEPYAASTKIDLYQRKMAYPNNKLAQILHAKELQRRLNKEKNNKIQVISSCPLFTSTEIFPDNLFGKIGHFFSFSVDAGIFAPLCSLFSNKLNGGEFVTNAKVFIASQSWSDDAIRTVTKYGLRDIVVGLLPPFILLFQRFTYGCHIHSSSPESKDEKLAKELYDWSERIVIAKGF